VKERAPARELNRTGSPAAGEVAGEVVETGQDLGAVDEADTGAGFGGDVLG
jgi:hypothetical protein